MARTTVQSVASLLPKLSDPDPDIRFMTLSDLNNLLRSPTSSYLLTDLVTSARVFDGLLKALIDKNGEVQNQALKWLVHLPDFGSLHD